MLETGLCEGEGGNKKEKGETGFVKHSAGSVIGLSMDLPPCLAWENASWPVAITFFS